MRWKFYLGIAVSGLFLYISFRQIDLHKLWAALVGADYLYLIPVVLLTVLTFWIRAYRWRYLLESVKDIGTATLFSATMIGFGANNVLPARLGEFVRAYAIARSAQISRSASFATIVIERVFDGLTLLLFMVVVVLFFPFPHWVEIGAVLAAALYLGVLACLILLKARPQFVLDAVYLILTPLPERLRAGAGGLLRSFSGGLAVLSDAPQIVLIALLSIVLWLLVVALIHTALLAFDLPLPPYAAFVLLIILSLGVMLPSSPGFIGTFEYSCILSLALFQVPNDTALGFSIVFHATQFFPQTLIGLLYFWRENLSWAEISRSVAA